MLGTCWAIRCNGDHIYWMLKSSASGNGPNTGPSCSCGLLRSSRNIHQQTQSSGQGGLIIKSRTPTNEGSSKRAQHFKAAPWTYKVFSQGRAHGEAC